MTRSLTSGMQAAIAAERGTIAHLFELDASGGTLRLATTPHDVVWGGYTWQGIGGALTFDVVTEQTDLSGQGTNLTLSGVDQTIIATILTNNVRGREAVVYLVHFDADLQIGDDRLVLYRGFLNGQVQISEHRETESLAAGSVTVTTRIVTRLDELGQVRGARSNVGSLRDMLRRGGFTGTALNDTFFLLVPRLQNVPIYWGQKTPATGTQNDYSDPSNLGPWGPKAPGYP